MRRVIRRHIRRRSDGVDLAIDVNAVVAVNRGPGAESVQSTSVTQSASARAAEEGPDSPAENRDTSSKEEQ
jgi:hypothetical protein